MVSRQWGIVHFEVLRALKRNYRKTSKNVSKWINKYFTSVEKKINYEYDRSDLGNVLVNVTLGINFRATQSYVLDVSPSVAGNLSWREHS